MHILINKKYLTFNNYKVKCVVGKRGIGFKRKEGDLGQMSTNEFVSLINGELSKSIAKFE